MATVAAKPTALSAAAREPRPAAGLFVLLPGPLGWLAFFYVLPLALLLVYALWSVSPDQTIDHTVTFANFRRFFETSLYPRVLWRTVQLALLVTLTSAVISFP